MAKRLRELLIRAFDVLRTDGLLPVIRNGFTLAVSWVVQFDRCYLYEHTVEERNEADFLPRLENVTMKVVRTREEADELKAATGIDLLRRFVNSRRGLEKGAIAFCLFVGGEIAHIGWVALSEEAKQGVDTFPYRVDFANGEACTGATETVPEFRGKGLMAYGYFKRLEFLRQQGFTLSRNAVTVDNIASQRAHAKFGPRIYAELRCLRVLGRTLYSRERPLAESVRR